MSYKLILFFMFTLVAQAKEPFVIPQSLLNQVEKGNAEAAYFIADTYYNGSQDFNPDKAKAITWFKKAADMGDPHAMLALADELDAEDKRQEALVWYTNASDLGMGEAFDRIASYHYYGYAGLEKNCHTAYQWYEKAEAKEVETAFNNHAWILATTADKDCRNPERAVKIIYELLSLYETEDEIPWNVLDTKAAVLASVSDFGAAIKLQKWLLNELKNVEVNTKSYKDHLEFYLARKPWIQQ